MRKSLAIAVICVLCSFAAFAFDRGFEQREFGEAVKPPITAGTVHKDSPTLGLCIVHTDEIARAGAIDLYIYYVDIDGVPGFSKGDIVKRESRHLCASM